VEEVKREREGVEVEERGEAFVIVAVKILVVSGDFVEGLSGDKGVLGDSEGELLDDGELGEEHSPSGFTLLRFTLALLF